MQKQVYEFISNQNSDPIIERRICAVLGTEFPIFQSDISFYDKISPNFNGKKYQIPLPTLCPEERARRRSTWRNERKLYRRKCDFSGKMIISAFSPEKKNVVYAPDARRSDKRNPLDYGKNFDEKVSFFKQFKALFDQVPTLSIVSTNGVNSDYCNHSGEMKDCYLTHASWDCEKSSYSSNIRRTNNSLDILESFYCEHSYELVGCEKCYKTYRGIYAENCQNSYFLFDCKNCEYCIGCWNLIDKQYCIFNQQKTKEEYEILVQKIQNDSEYLQKVKQEWLQTQDQWIYKYANQIGSEAVYGNNIKYGQRCVNCFNVSDMIDCKYAINGAGDCKDTQDGYGIGEHASLGYEIVDTGLQGYVNCFMIIGRECSHTYYCHNCYGCKNCFGCIGLRNQEYCILNKQYTKEEYQKEVAHIIESMISQGERGEFFPTELSPFAYNESIANERYPMTKQEALGRGYDWLDKEYPINVPEGVEKVEGERVKELGDEDILKVAILCQETGKPFRIVKPELEFYRTHKLPLPTRHPDVRYMNRRNLQPGRMLHKRKCDQCAKNIISVYPKESSYSVYCEACYNKEIYG